MKSHPRTQKTFADDGSLGNVALLEVCPEALAARVGLAGASRRRRARCLSGGLGSAGLAKAAGCGWQLWAGSHDVAGGPGKFHAPWPWPLAVVS